VLLRQECQFDPGRGGGEGGSWGSSVVQQRVVQCSGEVTDRRGAAAVTETPGALVACPMTSSLSL